MRPSEALSAAGGVLQIAGFLAIILRSSGELEPKLADSAYELFGRLRAGLHLNSDALAPRPAPVLASARERAANDPADEVAQLRGEVEDLRAAFGEQLTASEQRLAALRERSEASERELVQSARNLEREMLAGRRSSLQRELVGACVFLLGTALVLAGTLVSG